MGGRPGGRGRGIGPGRLASARLSEVGAMRRCTAFYYATISEIDLQVGRMVSVLQQKGLYDSTLVVFTADHGECLGFHHLLLKSDHLYDPLARVPLILRPPGARPAASAYEGLVSNTDLAPTLLSAAGLNPPPEMKGQDLLSPGAGRKVVFCETSNGYIMARTRSRKLLWTQAAEHRLFFDLASDPLEMTNRMDDARFQGEIAELTRAIEAWRPGPVTAAYLNEDAPRIQQPNVPSRAQRQEEQQWYRQQMQRWQSVRPR